MGLGSDGSRSENAETTEEKSELISKGGKMKALEQHGRRVGGGTRGK